SIVKSNGSSHGPHGNGGTLARLPDAFLEPFPCSHSGSKKRSFFITGRTRPFGNHRTAGTRPYNYLTPRSRLRDLRGFVWESPGEVQTRSATLAEIAGVGREKGWSPQSYGVWFWL